MKLHSALFLNIYQRLFHRFGQQHWWPGETPFEVAIGAILTQNTNWQNVEKAITNLKNAGILSPLGIRKVSAKRLAHLIRPAGYYNLKSARLKEFIGFLFKGYNGRLDFMRKQKTSSLRIELLNINGIGPETADSILLYALGKPIFVIDAYTRRIFSRHRIISEDTGYSEIQQFFMQSLPRSVKLFNEYHALLVKVGKEYCKRIPRCKGCPLAPLDLTAAACLPQAEGL